LVEDGSLELNDMAAAAELSRWYFARCFLKDFGQTPHRWLLAQRLDRAKGLLIETEDSLNNIAGLCGFSSQSHMTTLMRKQTGLTPSAWRNTYRH